MLENSDTNTHGLFGKWQGIAVANLKPCWDLRESAPLLAEKLFKTDSGAETACEALAVCLPYARTHKPLANGPFIRPTGHGRSYYIDLSRLIDIEAGQSGYLCIKGSEVASDDYHTWMATLRERRQFWGLNGGNEFFSFRSPIDTTLNNLERWPVIERKFPGAVTFPEASAEACIALEFQTKYFGRYGHFARVPLPLFVYRWPNHIGQNAWNLLDSLLTRRAAEVAREMLVQGLAVYIYYYPTLPLRLMSGDGLQNPLFPRRDPVPGSAAIGGSSSALASKPLKRLETSEIIGRWSELLSRMLALGYLPKGPGSILTADCLQPWNAIIDGGFADVDSIVSMVSMDPADVDDSLRRSLRSLIVLTAYIILGPAALSVEFRDRFPELTWIVVGDVSRRLQREQETGGIPNALQILIESNGVYDDLDKIFRNARGR